MSENIKIRGKKKKNWLTDKNGSHTAHTVGRHLHLRGCGCALSGVRYVANAPRCVKVKTAISKSGSLIPRWSGELLHL